MNSYYIQYKASKEGVRTIHKRNCATMPKIEHCLFLGEFYSSTGLYNHTAHMFDDWQIAMCDGCSD
ncbi:hypothetical protein [Carboxylicivirga mesophila]|uniref:hypothetical protein n=1 Tax=Carboxylicivirga mesophila TaxID=1166478 RepID=UPI001BA4428D|nr:hypothetical protein [Carboxylicivirga mesophila]